MSYTYLLEQGEVSSVECFSDIPAYALSRSTSTAGMFCSSGSETGSCRGSRFGTTFAPLMEDRGEESQMSFAEDSHAKTSQLQEEEPALTASEADFGERWPESSARWDHESSLWRTRQCLLFEDSEESLETWPQWGFTRGTEFWEATKPVGVRTESGCGSSLMRPTASDGLRHKFQVRSLIRSGHQDGNLSEQLARVHGLKLTRTACEILMGWPLMWTACEPLGMVNVQDWLRLHGES